MTWDIKVHKKDCPHKRYPTWASKTGGTYCNESPDMKEECSFNYCPLKIEQ